MHIYHSISNEGSLHTAQLFDTHIPFRQIPPIQALWIEIIPIIGSWLMLTTSMRGEHLISG
jgi:hypothetical protein